MSKKFKDFSKSKNADSKKNPLISEMKSPASEGKKTTHTTQNSQTTSQFLEPKKSEENLEEKKQGTKSEKWKLNSSAFL